MEGAVSLKRFLGAIIGIIMMFNGFVMDSYAQSGYDFEGISREIVDYYEDEGAISFRTALSLGFLGEDFGIEKDDIEERIGVKDGDNVAQFVSNIIYNVSIGEADSRENKKWLEGLSDSQKKDGSFYIEKGDEHLANTAWAVIALDICGWEYDIQKAVKYMLSKQISSGEFYKKDDIDTTSMVLQALSKHMDIGGVNESVEKALEFIQDSQLEDGEFLFMGDKNPYTLCEVIQALISLEEDVYSSMWEKDGENLVDVLMRYYDDASFKYNTKFGAEEKMCTERAFMTVVQLQKGYIFESAQNFNDFGGSDGDGEDSAGSTGDIEIELLNDEYEKRSEAFLEINISNNMDKDVSGVLMVCLYDEDEEEMRYYSYSYIDMEKDGDARIDIGFYIPDNDDQLIKVMMLDSLKNMNVIANTLEVEVD